MPGKRWKQDSSARKMKFETQQLTTVDLPMKMKNINLAILVSLAAFSAHLRAAEKLIEAESFTHMGGWVIDQQSMDQMGSPYAMAHGLGRQVKDASTEITIEKSGVYEVWVRTRDWVGQWKGDDVRPAMRAVGSPGKFKLSIDGRQVSETFGVTGAKWHWQDGGSVDLA